MDEFKRKLIQLVHSRHASWKTIYSILKYDASRNINEETQYAFKNQPQTQQLQRDLQLISVDRLLFQYSSQNIHLITIFDAEYPERLKNIYQPPWVLFAKGDLSLLKIDKALAVVGSRNATDYGFKSIDFLFPSLIEKNIMIVSGLAKGIDAHAHKTAIKLVGKTIGVIAGGFHHLYPRENSKLAEYMMEKQLVVSEYPPSTYPAKWHFPMRNRIISGLSEGTLVIEARKKSGSLITADFALNDGRNVFAVPGSILTPDSDGVHYLIQQGAKLIKSPEDILEELGN
ncbi:DNA-processing protein DprA [Bacillus sp. ISL-35]|uniref:DNA-processing protein DprA n=1 Tax=Bacillus sp. ISL-35 TaxID=2819122 RepID=UPI001BE7B767|nr:DNA-processing protein DprA [Bacillus sp. ISL-35]MBT2681340.1 DNA-processing protein DprA [Bacillus sp. ISL-35]MBT2701807.1 DNA-processing protein DprA [Chryseobacterium sp. ISL-80]